MVTWVSGLPSVNLAGFDYTELQREELNLAFLSAELFDDTQTQVSSFRERLDQCISVWKFKIRCLS